MDFLKCEAEKLLRPSAPTTPVYTPPYYPSYPINTQTSASPSYTMFSQSPNWLSWALGAVAVVLLSRRGR